MCGKQKCEVRKKLAGLLTKLQRVFKGRIEGEAHDKEAELKMSATMAIPSKLEDQLSKIVGLEANWDSYDAGKPNRVAVDHAREAVMLSERLFPHNIVASAEGGVALCWDQGEKHAYIEFSNDGTAIMAKYEGKNDPCIKEFPPNKQAILEALGEVYPFFPHAA